MDEMSLRQFCLRNHKEYLTDQWNLPENEGFDPDRTGYASHKKIWWHCDKGHKWQAMISDRVTKDVGCPYCANRKVLEGYNDLASTCPELASQ